MKTSLLESHFNSQFCKIFQSTFFEEHLQTAASENVLIKIIHRELTLHRKRCFQHQHQNQVEMFVSIP